MGSDEWFMTIVVVISTVFVVSHRAVDPLRVAQGYGGVCLSSPHAVAFNRVAWRQCFSPRARISQAALRQGTTFDEFV